MRRCDRDMPCVRGIFVKRCKIDGHEIKLEERCKISDDNPKLREIFPLPPIAKICENCENYKPQTEWPYEGICPLKPGENVRNLDGCDANFSPKKLMLEEAERERYYPWAKL